ncbi:chorismate-binding protein [Winogradskyella bathintestinalis]|uniref:Chorismate-binding protein n=1 Tax=Winogradskyella bathintestinalis TaxID=3035208 RepID=A0ABT7ZW33_9FLAO|nr:chorismate-binding protein [Winogradskyella bathintestinalis]MDN3493198.1 chorismate-binding protein [Winogradskyella bathintestinalis]
MNHDSFFETLETQFTNQLPFVVYSRPINSVVKCWLQKDDELHSTEFFTESGFVFAPFNLSEKSILFPKDKCEYSEIRCENLEIESVESTKITVDEYDKINHINLVLKGREAINNGDLEKVVLSRCETKVIQNNNPISIFKQLYNSYKNAMVYCWYHPKVGLWIGATPELLFKTEGKQLTTISLAGTQPYKQNSEPTWTEKEFVEQQIVTDYITRQLKPYTKQIEVSQVNTVRAGKLLHLKTKITSIIHEKAQLKSIIEALHPTPAVCGFPKPEAKTFILQHENYNREFYTGFLGELNLKISKTRNTNRRNVENNAYAVVKSQSNFYVNLRCMQLKGSNASIYVGGGITKDSNPEKEWEETVNKTATIVNVLD